MTYAFFNVLKNVIYLATTGYYPVGKLEIGSAFSLVTFNPVEKFRTAVALRTSNQFSRRLELGGRVAYGFGDQRLKYGGSIRYNITPKKRGMLTTYYSYDIEQIGQSPDAAAIGSTFGTLLRTGPLDKLTFVQRAGINLEKDIRKDVILYGGYEWKEFTALGLANYVRPDGVGGNDTINQIQTSEVIFRYRWAKNEEFISGSFDRTSVRSKYPILSLQGVFGIKDLLGGDYNYQKIDFVLEHNARLGFLGRMRYGFNVGYIFGTAAYPFLKVHEGNQSYWLQLNTFNKMDFFEFISDRYVTALIENHWDGFFLDRIPGVRKAKMRLVTTARGAIGWISDRHLQEMYLPSFTREFNNIPYVEVSVGLEKHLKDWSSGCILAFDTYRSERTVAQHSKLWNSCALRDQLLGTMKLHTKEIKKSYRGRDVVKGISVEVNQGEIVGLLGPNGAGKTTSFYMIVGLVTPDSGRVYLDDTDITDYPMYKRSQLGIGYLPQEVSVFRKLSVEDNVLAILEMGKLSKQERIAKLEQLLDDFSLKHVRKNMGARLSGGEKRRTEIARALATDPKFVLLDEPFAGVDPIAVEDIQSIVSELRERNIGILITDHNVQETLSITDRAYLLFEGDILKSGTAEELAADEQVRKVYLGRNFELRKK